MFVIHPRCNEFQQQQSKGFQFNMQRMDNIESMIRYGVECDHLDFKLKQYVKENFDDFLRDVMAMANSCRPGKKYIIIGVKEDRVNGNNLVGMDSSTMDIASYQQVVRDNIEPNISVAFTVTHLEGKQFGIFTIEAGDDRPYMMSKKRKTIEKGTCLIRVGTSQHPMMRRDLDLILEQKLKGARFSGEVTASVKLENGEMTVRVQRFVVLPSDQEANKIRQTMENIKYRQPYVQNMINGPGPDHYGNMGLKELKSALSRIRTTYFHEDLVKKFEELGVKVNFTLFNSGTEYIRDASVLLIIPLIDGLEIAPRKYRLPQIMAIATPFEGTLLRSEYPEVTQKDGYYHIFQHIGELKHKIPMDLFVTPLRVFANDKLANKTVTAKFTLYGENLAEPLEREVPLHFGE